jgi:predicted O-methyltransferase YrrM
VPGEAQTRLAERDDPFDLVFLDIDKEFYADVLPLCERLLKPGGLLVADNVAFTDAAPFNRAIATSDAWRAVSLFTFLPFHSPEHDAICLALRI